MPLPGPHPPFSLPARVFSPELAAYTPKNGKFTCLSGDRTIDFSSVNDDYCDCPDGSDEPGPWPPRPYRAAGRRPSADAFCPLLAVQGTGTSACPNGQFFCRNAGFIGKFIPSSRVGDRVCGTCDQAFHQTYQTYGT